MTEIVPASADAFDFAGWEAQERNRSRLRAEAWDSNKSRLFEAFGQAGITRVTVQFDGYGDQGQIEATEACIGDTPAELPDGTVELDEPDENAAALQRADVTVSEAIEKLVYDFLEETHAGWENNDGAYGDFTFDVNSRTVTLAYNERYTATNYSEHVF